MYERRAAASVTSIDGRGVVVADFGGGKDCGGMNDATGGATSTGDSFFEGETKLSDFTESPRLEVPKALPMMRMVL